MNFEFDPALPNFGDEIKQIPGYSARDAFPIQAMVFEAEAIVRLPEFLNSIGARKDAPLWVVMDETVMWRNGAELKPFVQNLLSEAGWSTEAIVLTPEHGAPVHTDTYQVERVKAKLTRDAAVIGLGSGTVTDVAKHACFLFERETGAHIPFIVAATANSVSAFTSNTASVEVGGVKKTLPSRYLDVLLCDLETLASAPHALTVAGVGDLVVVFGSFADWFLAKRVGLDANYSDLPRTLLAPLDEAFLNHADDIREGTSYGSEILAKLLALEGLATSLAHTSAPVSGYEHLISHVIDLETTRYDLPPTLHGTQVALLTVLTTLAFGEFIKGFDPATLDIDACYPSAEEMRTRIEKNFAALDPSGGIASECWNEYAKKLDAWKHNRATFKQFLREWDSIRADLEGMVRPPTLLIEILQRMGSPTHFDQLNPPVPTEHIKFGFMNAPYIRNRFTLGDLFIFLNWDMEQVWDTVWRASRALVNAVPV